MEVSPPNQGGPSPAGRPAIGDPNRPAAFEQLVEHSPSLFAVVDRGYRYCMVNPAFARMRRRPADQIIGRTSEEVLGPAVWEMARPHLEQSFAELKVSRYSDWFVYADQSRRFMEVHYYPIIGPDGRVEQVAAEIHDATERRQAEDALRDREEHYRLLSEAIPQPIWRCDAYGGLIECNQHWYDYTGQTRQQASGAGWMQALHPDDRFNLIDRVRYDATGLIYESTYRVRRASDGSYRWHLARAVPMKDADGRILYWIGYSADIDDQKRAEEALRRSEARNRALLGAIPDQMVQMRRDGVYLDVLTPSGFESILDRADCVGKSVREILPQDRARRLLRKLTRAFATGQPQVIEYRVTLPDGQKRDREARIVVSGPDEALVLARDTTDRKQAERTLRDHKDALAKLNAELEERVSARTAALEEANRRLQAEIAERTATEESLRRAMDRLRYFESEVLLAEERERRQLAMDLHDSPVQALTVAKMKLSRLRLPEGPSAGGEADRERTLAELGELVDQAYDSLRSLTFQLSPPILYDLGLLAALEWLATDISKRFHGRSRLEITVQDDGQPKPTDERVRVILFRCVRELLINVAKHSLARHARIALLADNGMLLITVQDDGKGFTWTGAPTDSAACAGSQGGQGGSGSPGTFGLFSIGERLASIGGKMRIRSAPGSGTAVTLQAPLSHDQGGR